MKFFAQIFSIALVMTLISSTAFAQNKGKGSIQASARVVQNNNVSSTSSLNIDKIALNSGVHTVSPRANKAGGFSLSGRPGDQVFISFDKATRLKSKDGDMLQFDAVSPVFSHSSNRTKAQSFKSEEGGTASLNAQNGELFVWFGGRVNSDRAKSGAYSGTYTVTIEYMN